MESPDIPRGRSPQVVRAVSPPQPVRIDLGAMYGRPPHYEPFKTRLYLPDLSAVVEGRLEAWIMTTSGWYGACRYEIRVVNTKIMQSHLVPERLIRPAG